MWNLIVWIVTGAVAGYAAGVVVQKEKQFNLWDIVVGIVGAMVGGFLFNLIQALPFVTEIATAFVGAVIVLVVWQRFIR